MNPAGRCPACETQLPARDRAARDHGRPGASLFVFLPGGSDGERLFQPGQEHDGGAL